jgi:hypothetical protein
MFENYVNIHFVEKMMYFYNAEHSRILDGMEIGDWRIG